MGRPDQRRTAVPSGRDRRAPAGTTGVVPPDRDPPTGPGGGRLTVAGLGLRLPGVTHPGHLVGRFGGASAPAPAVRRFDAPGSDLEPVERPAWGPVEPRIPATVAGRGLRALPYESLLALAAAAAARDAMVAGGPSGPDVVPTRARSPAPTATAAGHPVTVAPASRPRPDDGPVAVLWASSTAGLTEYATVCVEAATLSPGLCSPMLGPASAFNGPAATVSIRLGLDGPNETLTGDTTAGLAALAEAGRLIAEGSAAAALVGGSATVSRWSLAGGAGDADGAGCLALRPCRDGEPGVRLGRILRLGLDPTDLVTQVRDLVRSRPAPSTLPDGPLVVSARDVDLVDALAADHARPVWHLERVLGDLGAAGGLFAAICAVAHCVHTPSPARLLVLAVEPCGNAAIMEVSTWEASTLSSGCWADTSPSGEVTAPRTSTPTVS